MITTVVSIFKMPLVRRCLLGLVMITIGFSIGYKFMSNKLKNECKEKAMCQGENKMLKEQIKMLKIDLDTLRDVVIALAKTEKIKVDNHISGTKVKDGASLTFIPKTTAEIITQDSTKNKHPNKKRDGFLKRLFSRREDHE